MAEHRTISKNNQNTVLTTPFPNVDSHPKQVPKTLKQVFRFYCVNLKIHCETIKFDKRIVPKIFTFQLAYFEYFLIKKNKKNKKNY